MAESLTISAAARLCRCDRRTLQRAIHAGRLHLDAQHALSREELIATGYLVPDTPQATSQAASQDTPQALPQGALLLAALGRLTLAVEHLSQEVRQLRLSSPALPHGTPQWTPQDTPQSAPQEPADLQPHHLPHKGSHVALGATQASTGSSTRPRGRAQPRAAQEAMQHGEQREAGFDTTKFTLGRLCPRGHEHAATGQTLRKQHSGTCIACEREQQRERRRARRQAAGRSPAC
jgi:hypothetical protein